MLQTFCQFSLFVLSCLAHTYPPMSAVSIVLKASFVFFFSPSSYANLRNNAKCKRICCKPLGYTRTNRTSGRHVLICFFLLAAPHRRLLLTLTQMACSRLLKLRMLGWPVGPFGGFVLTCMTFSPHCSGLALFLVYLFFFHLCMCAHRSGYALVCVYV